MFNQFFNSTLSNPNSLPPCFPPAISNFHQLDILESDVYEVLSFLEWQKSSGPDNISSSMKYCAFPLTELLHKSFVMSIHSGLLPGQWKLHLIVPVFKLGKKAIARNYRAISLLCTVPKVLEKIVYRKIVDFFYFQISVPQYGFIKKIHCTQASYIYLSHC